MSVCICMCTCVDVSVSAGMKDFRDFADFSDLKKNIHRLAFTKCQYVIYDLYDTYMYNISLNPILYITLDIARTENPSKKVAHG